MTISAFPIAFKDKDDGKIKVRVGMELRDFFASSFVSSGHVFKCISDGTTPIMVAEQAYLMADAMLQIKLSSKPKKKPVVELQKKEPSKHEFIGYEDIT